MAKKKKPEPQPDVRVSNHGTIMLIEPVTEHAKEWVEENVVTESWFGDAFACEPRYAFDIVSGMQDFGLEVV